MGLTSSLFTGLSGMKNNEFRMDVIGDNIANVNTYAFKSSRATFKTLFAQTYSFGSAPTGSFGGTNPKQVGAGAQVAGITRDFSGGAPETTGVKTDMAVQGDGLFILEKPDGQSVYTRDGSMQFNAENYLMSADGYFLQGYGVDSSFNLVDGTLSKIRIPLGEITTSNTTGNAAFSGNLNTGGVAAVDRQTNTSQAFTGDPTAATLLTALTDATGAMFEDGNIIQLNEASKGGANLPTKEFTVTATSTLQDLMDWMQNVLGINTDANLPDMTADGVANPGVTYDEATDIITIVTNIGMDNALELGNSAFKVLQGTAAAAPARSLPLTFSASGDKENTDFGESVHTSFTAYDSLGNEINIEVTYVLQEKDDGTVWRYFAESSDDTDADRCVGTGTVTFDSQGQYVTSTGTQATIDRDQTGATTPMVVTFDFSSLDAYDMEDSSISLLSQDGFPAGTLQDFSVASDGTIIGSFTNGLNRILGQVVLATFRNYEGLIADGNNLYMSGPNSGTPIIKKPMDLGAGSISPSSLELSNVDLSREFINLIVSSTGFSAASRVIQTSDQLLNELIAMTR